MKTLAETLNPETSKQCKACKLYLNQFPLYDNKTNADIFWVGLSAVQIDDHNKKNIPLSPTTKSGQLIYTVEESCSNDYTFYKTNLVKCLPLNENKIRYPELMEMNKCYPNLLNELDELQPKLVFLLGKQVSDFVLKKNGFPANPLGNDYLYKTYFTGHHYLIPVHHPSYILVYKRKQIDKYVNGIVNIIKSLKEVYQEAI